MNTKYFWNGVRAGMLVMMLSGGAFAQDTGASMDRTADGSAKKGEVDLGNVVISEEETPVADLPASVSVIEGEELERVPFKKGIDVLRAVPNLLTTDYNQGGVPGEFVLRGFSGGHGNVAAVFIDGAPLNESNSHADGIADFNVIIPEEIERIEVIRGPFSVLYGNYVRGGSINIITKKRVNENTVNLSLGYWDSERGVLTLGRSYERFSQYYATEYYITDGYRDHSDLQRGNLSAKWVFDLTERSSLRLGVRSYSTAWDGPGYLPQTLWDAGRYTESNAPDDGGRKERQEINANYDYEIGLNDQIGITVFHYESNLTRFANIAAAPLGGEENNVLTGRLAKVLYSKRGSYLTQEDWLLLGFDFQQEIGDSRQWSVAQGRVRQIQNRDFEFVQNNYAVFAQAETRPVSPLKVTLGLRYDMFDGEVDFAIAPNAQTPVGEYDNDLKIFSPKGGVLYTVTPGFDLFANAGTGFFLPSGFNKFVDPNLQEARLVSYEIGTRFQPVPRVQGSLAYYIIDTQDDIVTRFDQTLNQNVLENTGESRRQGIELDTQIGITEEIFFFGAASLIKAEYEDFVTGGNATTDPSDFSGNRIQGIPRYIFQTGFDYLSQMGIGSRITVRGTGERELDAANTLSYPGYTVADAEVYYRTNGYTFGIKANNVFDRNFAEFITVSGGQKRYAVADGFNIIGSFRAEF